MSGTLVRVVCLLALVLAAPLSAAAQQGTAEIRGRVADAQGAVLPGVTVTVRNQATGMYRETTVNEDGSYFVSGIVPGPYEVTAALQGFKTVKQAVQLEVGKTASLDLTLDVGSVEEVVNVTAEAPIVDVTSKEVGGNITARSPTCRRSTATSSASSACCPVSSRTSAPNRSGPTRSARTAATRARTTTCSMARTTTTT
jgi:Carboxypeptidase regulatory-like domain